MTLQSLSHFYGPLLDSLPGRPGPFLPSCFPAGQLQCALVPVTASPHVQGFALPLAELLGIPLCPLLQPVGIPLNGGQPRGVAITPPSCQQQTC